MKTLQVRNVPDDLHRRLKARAAQEGRSLSDLVLVELRRVADRPSRDELLARLAEQPLLAEPSAESSAEILRAERDTR